jgi:hypothetical protein
MLSPRAFGSFLAHFASINNPFECLGSSGSFKRVSTFAKRLGISLSNNADSENLQPSRSVVCF